MGSIKFMTNELRTRNLRYNTIVTGMSNLESRWRQCVIVVSNSLKIANGALHIRKYFQQDSKATAIEMVDNIKKEFEINLKNVAWMDKTTKDAALDKLKSMSTHIGFPVELMDDKKLIEFYQDVDIDENKYLESILKINIFTTNRIFKKLHEPVNKTDWTMHANSAEINAFYSSIENSIRKSKDISMIFILNLIVFNIKKSLLVFYKDNSSQLIVHDT